MLFSLNVHGYIDTYVKAYMTVPSLLGIELFLPLVELNSYKIVTHAPSAILELSCTNQLASSQLLE